MARHRPDHRDRRPSIRQDDLPSPFHRLHRPGKILIGLPETHLHRGLTFVVMLLRAHLSQDILILSTVAPPNSASRGPAQPYSVGPSVDLAVPPAPHPQKRLSNLMSCTASPASNPG